MNKKIIWGTVVAVILLGGGVYYMDTYNSSVTPVVDDIATNTHMDTAAQKNSELVDSGTKDFDSKLYINTKYNYSLYYPKSFFAFEWPGKQKGERPYLVERTGDKDMVLMTPYSLLSETWDSTEYLDSPWLRINRENGTAWITGSNSVDDFWSKLSKVDERGNIVNVFLKKESIGGVDFIVFNQKNWDISSQSYLWALQALFMYNGNFFWISSSPKIDQFQFYSIIRSFTPPKSAAIPSVDIRIDSITPAGTTWGQTITIKGKGFSGHDTLVRIKGDNVNAILWGGVPVSDSEIKITIPSSMDVCIEYTGASGKPCSSYQKLLWGTYYVNIEGQNGSSNPIRFDIYRS
ncbi:MAG: IPT/TIG domain-containing protein [Candidatus Pacebacteria bacterium]|nr:IPT/TIG domain-containing protein [Candidatus Paceibacterota bacterium]